MKRFRPIHAMALVALVVGALVAADMTLGSHAGATTVRPGADGLVTLDVSTLGRGEVRFYRFLNAGSQEVRFLVGRDRAGVVQVAFDASETHAKLGRGFRHEGDWLVDNKCDSAVRLDSVNEGGRGCRPVPLPHRLDGDRLVLTEADVLRGWRYFQ